VIATGSSLRTGGASDGGKDYRGRGEGNEAFKNFISDLTVETGRGNRGAIGIDYLSNNVGAVRNVTVRSGDGLGVAGISMTRKWPGPALLRNVSVTGFNYGIDVAQPEYTLTLTGIELKGQQRAGIHNRGNVLSLHDLLSQNTVPAVYNSFDQALTVLVGAQLTGGNASTAAVVNERGTIFLRDVSTSGYAAAVDDRGRMLRQSDVIEYASGVRDGSRSLRLETRSIPEPPSDTAASRAGTGRFAEVTLPGESDDALPALQAAIDSGAETVYLPAGTYRLSDTLHVRGNVQRIEFNGAELALARDTEFGDGRPLVRVGAGKGDVVLLNQIGRYNAEGSATRPGVMLEHATSRALVLRDSFFEGYQNSGHSGPLFLEDVCCGPLLIRGQQVWAWQLNLEAAEGPMLVNDGGSVQIFGLKTEQPVTAIETRNGGQTEVLGGLLYPVGVVPKDVPAFLNLGGGQALVYAVSAHREAANYAVQAETLLDGARRRVLRGNVPVRGAHGSVVVLLE
jgi:hypothetical protein